MLTSLLRFLSKWRPGRTSRGEIPQDLRSIPWSLPWTATTDTLEGELQREVSKDHQLAGRPAIAVARRIDTDDVLFWLPDGPGRVASVHLTWSRKRETNPQVPWTQIYQTAEEWIEKEMRPDHTERTSHDGNSPANP